MATSIARTISADQNYGDIMEINEAHETVDDIVALIQEIDADTALPPHVKVEVLSKIANTVGPSIYRHLESQLRPGGSGLITRRL